MLEKKKNIGAYLLCLLCLSICRLVVLAQLVDQLITDPEIEGLNPFTDGTIRKWQTIKCRKFGACVLCLLCLSACQLAAVALSVDELTIDPEIEGLNPAAA
jgi:hypothetical protein